MANHKVLIVDESNATRERLRALLPKGNYEIREATDGDSGLALIEQERQNIRFILLGTELGPPTAWDILGQLRTDRDLYKVPLVLMTPDRAAALAQIKTPPSACELIETPFEKRQLQNAIKAALAKAKSAPAAPEPEPAPAAAVSSPAAADPETVAKPRDTYVPLPGLVAGPATIDMEEWETATAETTASQPVDSAAEAGLDELAALAQAALASDDAELAASDRSEDFLLTPSGLPAFASHEDLANLPISRDIPLAEIDRQLAELGVPSGMPDPRIEEKTPADRSAAAPLAAEDTHFDDETIHADVFSAATEPALAELAVAASSDRSDLMDDPAESAETQVAPTEPLFAAGDRLAASDEGQTEVWEAAAKLHATDRDLDDPTPNPVSQPALESPVPASTDLAANLEDIPTELTAEAEQLWQAASDLNTGWSEPLVESEPPLASEPLAEAEALFVSDERGIAADSDAYSFDFDDREESEQAAPPELEPPDEVEPAGEGSEAAAAWMAADAQDAAVVEASLAAAAIADSDPQAAMSQASPATTDAGFEPSEPSDDLAASDALSQTEPEVPAAAAPDDPWALPAAELSDAEAETDWFADPEPAVAEPTDAESAPLSAAAEPTAADFFPSLDDFMGAPAGEQSEASVAAPEPVADAAEPVEPDLSLAAEPEMAMETATAELGDLEPTSPLTAEPAAPVLAEIEALPVEATLAADDFFAMPAPEADFAPESEIPPLEPALSEDMLLGADNPFAMPPDLDWSEPEHEATATEAASDADAWEFDDPFAETETETETEADQSVVPSVEPELTDSPAEPSAESPERASPAADEWADFDAIALNAPTVIDAADSEDPFALPPDWPDSEDPDVSEAADVAEPDEASALDDFDAIALNAPTATDAAGNEDLFALPPDRPDSEDPDVSEAVDVAESDAASALDDFDVIALSAPVGTDAADSEDPFALPPDWAETTATAESALMEAESGDLESAVTADSIPTTAFEPEEDDEPEEVDDTTASLTAELAVDDTILTDRAAPTAATASVEPAPDNLNFQFDPNELVDESEDELEDDGDHTVLEDRRAVNLEHPDDRSDRTIFEDRREAGGEPAYLETPPIVEGPQLLEGVVTLRGFDDVIMRFHSQLETERLSALRDAPQYDQAGFELLLQAVRDESEAIRQAAEGLLLERLQATPVKRAAPEVERWLGLECIHILRGHSHWVQDVAIAPDGRTAISGSKDGTLKLWDLLTGRETLTLTGHNSAVLSVALSPDGTQIISSGRDNSIRIWDRETGQELRAIQGNRGHPIYVLAVSPDGQRIVSASADSNVKPKFDFSLDALLSRLPAQTSSPLISTLKLFCRTQAIRVWNAASGQPEGTLVGYARGLTDLCVSPDGELAIAGSRDQTIQIWEFKTGQLRNTLLGHVDEIRSVALSPDGRSLVSGSRDRTIKIWDLKTGHVLRTLRGHAQSVTSVAVDPGGQVAISGSRDGTVRIWDFHSGQHLNTLFGHGDLVRAIAISPDGKTIVSGSRDRTLRVWQRVAQ